MSRDDEAPETIREAWVGALLQAAYIDDPSAMGTRVADVMQEIGEPVLSKSERPAVVTDRVRRPTRRWVSLAAAASVIALLVIGFQVFGPSQSALAAIGQSLAAAAENIARRYQITVTYRTTDQESFDVNNDLFVQGNDRFALRHPSLVPGIDLWLGKEGDVAWVVPAIGPVRSGDDLALSRWLTAHEELPTPYLHITTVLHRMARGYILNELPDEKITLKNGSQVDCRHVVGKLRQSASRRLPVTIELWADSETGVAQRIEAAWDLPADQSGREKVSLELVEEPNLSSDWFRAEGHFSKPRRVIHFEAKE